MNLLGTGVIFYSPTVSPPSKPILCIKCAFFSFSFFFYCKSLVRTIEVLFPPAAPGLCVYLPRLGHQPLFPPFSVGHYIPLYYLLHARDILGPSCVPYTSDFVLQV